MNLTEPQRLALIELIDASSLNGDDVGLIEDAPSVNEAMLAELTALGVFEAPPHDGQFSLTTEALEYILGPLQ